MEMNLMGFLFGDNDKKYICKECGKTNYESDLFTREITEFCRANCYEKTERMCPCGSGNVILLEEYIENNAKELIN